MSDIYNGGTPPKAKSDLPFLPGKTSPILGDRWDRAYRYSFRIGRANEQTGDIVEYPDSISGMANTEITLNLPPSAIGISIPFAMTVSATNRGVIEESNGTVFRNISINGTTGVYQNRDVLGIPITPSTTAGKIVNAIFPSSVSAINNLKKAFNNVGPSDTDNASVIDETQTGYYQFWQLHNFFIEYSEKKKKVGSSNLRLIFYVPKDNISYICTPTNFDLRKDASNPMMYRYSISLRGWDIADASIRDIDTLADELPDANNLPSVKKALDTIRKARQAIQAAAGVIQGVQNDIFDVLNGVNQVVLGLKDVVGVTKTIADAYSTMLSNVNLLYQSNINQWNQLLGTRTDQMREAGLPSLINLGTQAKHEGKESNAQAVQLLTGVINTPSIADDILIRELGPLPASIDTQLARQQEVANQTTPTQVRALASKLQEVSDNLAYSSGLMDAEYAVTYGLPVPGIAPRQPNEDDILLSAQLEEAKAAFLSTLATGTLYQEKPLNPFTSANEILNINDQVPTPTSAFVITVNRGDTLEKIAQQYLGSANRAREIAILNNLRSPYIDEEGFNLNMSLAGDRTFIVNDRSNLVLGQTITLNGTALPTQRRKILSIQDIGNGTYKVSVDGTPSLDIYTSQANPYLHGRTPGTVGSGDQILIPSTDRPDQVGNDRSTPLAERLSFAEKVFKVDLALREDGDLDIGPSGDIARSYGYQNAVQALRLLVETEKGELAQHQQFGINASIGNKIDSDLLSEVKIRIRSAVISDPRFSDAVVSTRQEGTALYVRIEAQGRQGTGRIAVEFKITA